MLISVATATFYFIPFEEAIETIALAGFENIELDLYWERKNWAMAQHLKDVSPREAIQCVDRAGLKVSSIHDGGGVLEDVQSIKGYINPTLDQYLEHLGYAPDNLVFHTPHMEGKQDHNWWKSTSNQVASGLSQYKRNGSAVTIEYMCEFDGYTVAIPRPDELNEFALRHSLGVTLDTTHCALGNFDIVDSARILRETVRTIHLSDYHPGAPHAFIGDGNLNFLEFFRELDLSSLDSVTLECSLATPERSDQMMSQAERIDRLKLAKKRVEELIRVTDQVL